MDLHLNIEQQNLRKDARRFAKEVLSGVSNAMTGLPTPELRFAATKPFYEELVKQGFLKRLIPAPFGGEGSGLVDMAIVAEEFHTEDVNVSLTMLANILGLMPVFIAGTDAQRSRWIAPFLSCQGAPLAALANSEPGGSANFDSKAPGEGTRTVAERRDGHWLINGRKQWVSSATGWDGKGADLLAVVCRTGVLDDGAPALSIIGIENPVPGLSMEKALDSVGHRGHLTPRFRLENAIAPLENMIGGEGQARDIVSASFTGTAALVGVFATAVLRKAFDMTLAFAKSEKRGGPHPIIEYQAVGYGLADIKGKLEAMRALSWRSCWAMDAGIPGAAELSLHSKVYCSETACSAILDLIRIVGIDAYDSEFPLVHLLLDALAFPIFDGGNMGVRRKQLHAILNAHDYDPLSTVA